MDGIGYGSLGRRYRSAKLAWACESDLPVCSQSGAKLPDWHQQGMSWQSYMRCCRLVNESDCIVWRLAAVGTIGLFAHCWFGSRGIISVCRPCRELCAVEVPFEEYYALILLVQLRQTSNRWFKLLFDSFSDTIASLALIIVTDSQTETRDWGGSQFILRNFRGVPVRMFDIFYYTEKILGGSQLKKNTLYITA